MPACPYCNYPQSRKISHENGISRYQCIVCCETFNVEEDEPTPVKTSTKKEKSKFYYGAAPSKYQSAIGYLPFIILAVIIFNFSSCLFPSKPSSGSTRSSSTGTSSSSSSNYDHEIKAIAFAEQYVKEELSPRVASFPWMDRPHASKVSGHTNRWSVKSYVDTQNTYGAKLRLKYECVMDIRLHGETATLVYLRWLD